MSVERCVGTYSIIWSGVLGPIDEYGAVCWDRYLSVGQCVGTTVLYGAVCCDRYLCMDLCVVTDT